MEFLGIVRNTGPSLNFYKNVKFNKGENLEKEDFNISLILSLKCMQSRPAGVAGVEDIPVWMKVLRAFGSCE